MAYITFYEKCDYSLSTQGWQLRIHIAPSQIDIRNPSNRLKDIKNILTGIFNGNQVAMKLFQIENDDDIKGYNGVLSHFGKDRTEVGKEVCIYLPDSGIKQLSAAEYKAKLLLVWKRLQDAGIELYYQSIPGDKDVKTNSGSPTPFSFTSQNPNRDEWKDAHGILFKKFEAHGRHPILDVQFSLAEIKQQEIRYNNDALQPTAHFLINQKEQVHQDVQKQIDDINLRPATYRKSLFDDVTKVLLKKLAKECRDENLNQRNAKKLLQENLSYQQLADFYPHNRDGDLSLDIRLQELADRFGTLTDARIDELIDGLRTNYDSALNQIKMDFKEHQINLDTHFPNTNLDKLIENNPAQMQIIFRQLALLQQEESVNVYDNSNQIKEIDLLKKYKLDRESKSPNEYLGFFGSLNRIFGAFTKKEKFDAVDALIASLADPNITMDKIHLAPLQQGNLSKVLKQLHIDPNVFIEAKAGASLN